MNKESQIKEVVEKLRASIKELKSTKLGDSLLDHECFATRSMHQIIQVESQS